VCAASFDRVGRGKVMSEDRTLVMIPTYNESENVEVMVSGILSTGIDADLLFVDDNSPDGTGVILDRLAGKLPRLKVLHRPKKQGIGCAHKAGIRWAYQHGYTRLVTMDSDLSHSPSDIRRLLAASADKDVVVGSRFIDANSLEGWALSRKLMTHLGHFLTIAFLRLSQDCTNAFRFYRLDRIPAGLFEMVQSNSYSFFFESLQRLDINGFRISEIAIKLPARTYGHSKMKFRDIMYSVLFLVRLGWRARVKRASLIYVAPLANRDTGDDARLEWGRPPVDQEMYVRRSV
jgi:dolichol-phosphate mannosyltransferase